MTPVQCLPSAIDDYKGFLVFFARYFLNLICTQNSCHLQGRFARSCKSENCLQLEGKVCFTKKTRGAEREREVLHRCTYFCRYWSQVSKTSRQVSRCRPSARLYLVGLQRQVLGAPTLAEVKEKKRTEKSRKLIYLVARKHVPIGRMKAVLPKSSPVPSFL